MSRSNSPWVAVRGLSRYGSHHDSALPVCYVHTRSNNAWECLMSKTSKWLLGVGVSAVSIAWYIAAPVSHTIDVVRVEVAGIREARESLVTLIYTGLGPKKQQVFEKTVEMPRGVAEFYDVPEGNYTVRIATDR